MARTTSTALPRDDDRSLAASSRLIQISSIPRSNYINMHSYKNLGPGFHNIVNGNGYKCIHSTHYFSGLSRPTGHAVRRGNGFEQQCSIIYAPGACRAFHPLRSVSIPGSAGRGNPSKFISVVPLSFLLMVLFCCKAGSDHFVCKNRF